MPGQSWAGGTSPCAAQTDTSSWAQALGISPHLPGPVELAANGGLKLKSLFREERKKKKRDINTRLSEAIPSLMQFIHVSQATWYDSIETEPTKTLLPDFLLSLPIWFVPAATSSIFARNSCSVAGLFEEPGFWPVQASMAHSLQRPMLNASTAEASMHTWLWKTLHCLHIEWQRKA